MELDEVRREILATDGHLLIIGGPGCGKTTIALLKANQVVAGLKPEQSVVFLSFSRAAVRQIVDRMTGLVSRPTRRRLEVRTFHAFFMDVVRSYGWFRNGKQASFITPDAEQQLRAAFDGDWRAETLRMADEEGRYVFDLLARTTADLLDSYPALAKLYSDSYPVVVVDEFQDTNNEQWRAIRALSRASTIICLADPDQRIFDHLPGIDETRIQQAIDTLSPREFDLSKDNHRSPGQGLLAYANAVLRNDPNVAVPSNVTYVTYTGKPDLHLHHHLLALRTHLQESIGREPTIAVLAPTNALVGRLSEAVAADREHGDATYPRIDHELILDQDLATAAAHVIASIMEWPGLAEADAFIATMQAVCGYYRVKSVRTPGARRSLKTLERGLEDGAAGRRVRSKTARLLIAECQTGIQFTGSPVQDWQLARARLTGSAELAEIFSKARLIRLLKATDAIAWALTDAWNGTAYTNATAVVRHVLANRMIEENQFRDPAPIVFMNMFKSKGKEFDGVIIAETKYGNDQLIDFTKGPVEVQKRRRLLRVAITRARHHVVIIRDVRQPALVS